MTELFAGIDHVEIIMDDILVHGRTIDQHDSTLKQILDRCVQKNLKLNKAKVKLAQEQVEYVGQILTSEGVKISPEKVKAIVEMPAPTEISHVHTLLGMAKYSAKFMPELSQVTEPLRQLIQHCNKNGDSNFKWDAGHQAAFDKIKKMLSEAPLLRYYSLNEHIEIQCDASSHGLGMVLLQAGKPVAYSSRSLTSTQQGYSQIEKELLAIVESCRKFHSYIYGQSDVTVVTDHLPLISIFKKPLHMVPLRLQKMRLRLQQYDFEIVHRPGSKIPVPDNLSRRPLNEYSDEVEVLLTEVKPTHSITPRRLQKLKQETAQDETLQKLKDTIKQWPTNKQQLQREVQPY